MLPVVSIIGRKNSGKTRLIEALIPELKSRGLKVGILKHHSHFLKLEDADREGKDTYKYQVCGADIVVLSSLNKLMLIKNVQNPLGIDEICERYLNEIDIILIEGYKTGDKPKIEVFRQEIGREEGLLCSQEKDNLIAVVSDSKFDIDLPCFKPDDYSNIADFLENRLLGGL